MPPSLSYPTALNTTFALIDQFSASLSQPFDQTSGSAIPPDGHSLSSSPSPLPLLSAAATSLRAQVTKLSLLAITAPFTPSAVATILSALNDSVLPSLVTAALLVTPEKFTLAYYKEALLLVKAVIGDLKSLAEVVRIRGHESEKSRDATEHESKLVTECTGKVWEGCDELSRLANSGAAGFVASKAREYLELVRDAVKELEDWEPDADDENDGAFGDSEDSEDERGNYENKGSEEAKLLAHKETTLEVLRRIPMCMHVALKYRLEKGTWDESGSTQAQLLDEVLSKHRSISETVDEAVGTLQEGDMDACRVHTKSSQRVTLDLVELLLSVGSAREKGGREDVSKEDRYVLKAREWIRTVGEVTAISDTLDEV